MGYPAFKRTSKIWGFFVVVEDLKKKNLSACPDIVLDTGNMEINKIDKTHLT